MLSNLFGIYTGIKQGITSKKMQKQADRERGQTIGYANEGMNLAKQGLSESRNLYNSRMAGAGGMEQNILQNQAALMGNVNRNATSGSQALALAGAANGQSNQQFANLAQMEAQDKQNRYGYVQQGRAGVQAANQNLQNLYGGYSDADGQAAAQLGQASGANIMNGMKGIENAAIQAAMMAAGVPPVGGGGGGQAPVPSVIPQTSSYRTPAQQFGTAPTMSNIQAPGFVSPAGFYQMAPQMPTWNYQLPSTRKIG